MWAAEDKIVAEHQQKIREIYNTMIRDESDQSVVAALLLLVERIDRLVTAVEGSYKF